VRLNVCEQRLLEYLGSEEEFCKTELRINKVSLANFDLPKYFIHLYPVLALLMLHLQIVNPYEHHEVKEITNMKA